MEAKNTTQNFPEKLSNRLGELLQLTEYVIIVHDSLQRNNESGDRTALLSFQKLTNLNFRENLMSKVLFPKMAELSLKKYNQPLYVLFPVSILNKALEDDSDLRLVMKLFDENYLRLTKINTITEEGALKIADILLNAKIIEKLTYNQSKATKAETLKKKIIFIESIISEIEKL